MHIVANSFSGRVVMCSCCVFPERVPHCVGVVSCDSQDTVFSLVLMWASSAMRCTAVFSECVWFPRCL